MASKFLDDHHEFFLSDHIISAINVPLLTFTEYAAEWLDKLFKKVFAIKTGGVRYRTVIV